MTPSLRKISLLSRRNLWVNLLKITGVSAACFVFEACYGVPPAQDAPRKGDVKDITGVVRTADGRPVSGAEVSFTSGRFGDTIRTYSDENGCYRIEDVRGLAQTIHLQAEGPDQKQGVCDQAITGDQQFLSQLKCDIILKAE